VQGSGDDKEDDSSPESAEKNAGTNAPTESSPMRGNTSIPSLAELEKELAEDKEEEYVSRAK
jgi:hypothetical protein